MKIESLKQLEALLKLCRKQGVAAITVDGISLQLGSMPVKAEKQSFMAENFPDIPVITPYTPGGVTEQTKIVADSVAIATDGLTEDQLLFYSSRPEAFEGQQ